MKRNVAASGDWLPNPLELSRILEYMADEQWLSGADDRRFRLASVNKVN
jgi:hypothetical protein